MKRHHRLCALLPAAALVLASLSACGSPSSSSAAAPASSAADSSASISSDTAPASAAPAASTTDVPEPDSAVELSSDINLPLTTEDVDVSIWISVNPNAYNYMEKGMASNETYNELQARTGIGFDWVVCTPDNSAESFMLSIASQDYYDIYVDGNSQFNGGSDAAVEQDVFVDLADKIHEFCPNLESLLNADPSAKVAAMTDSGILVGAPQFFNKPRGLTHGFVARQDWLEEFGNTGLETYDDWHDYLTFIRDNHDGASFLLASSGCCMNGYLIGGYGVIGNIETNMGFSMPFFQEDGQVKFGPIEDGYLEYLKMVRQWYSEGLIYKDFVSQWNPFEPDMGLITGGELGIFMTDQWNIDSYDASMEDGGTWVAIQDPTKEAGDQLHFGDEMLTVNPIFWCISTACENPELVLQMFNYTYSEEGSLLMNYGVEGLTYEIGSDGLPHYTDFITDSGISLDFSLYCHVTTNAPYVLDVERSYEAYSQKEIDAVGIWATDVDSANVLPANISMTADESSRYSAIANDIATTISENILAIIVGDKDISDYEALRQQIKDMGIDTCIEIYQTAYDRYLQR